MNKVLKYLNLILLTITVLTLLFIYPSFIHLETMVLAVIILLIIVLSIYEIVRKKGIIINLKYNYICLIANIATLFILGRDLFDSFITMSGYSNLNLFTRTFGPSDKISSLYFVYNLKFLIIIYICILLYNLINLKKKGAK